MSPAINGWLTCSWYFMQYYNRRSGCKVLRWVCLSVCEDISGTIRAIFTIFNFVDVAYVRGSVHLRYVDDRPQRLSAGKGWRECTARAKCRPNLRLPCCTVNNVYFKAEHGMYFNCLKWLKQLHVQAATCNGWLVDQHLTAFSTQIGSYRAFKVTKRIAYFKYQLSTVAH